MEATTPHQSPAKGQPHVNAELRHQTPVPSMQALEASALQLLQERILSMGGKMPSPKALAMTVQALAAKAHRELTAQQKG